MTGIRIFKKVVLGLFLFLTLSGVVSRQETGASGILTLALLNDRFPINDALEVLNESPKPAFALMYKTFGSSWKNLEYLINNLSNIHDSTTVVVYTDCGACRPPRRPKGLFRIIAPNESILSLNRKLEKGNRTILSAYNKAYLDLKSHLPINSKVNYNLQISLEDNLTTKAYQVLRILAKQVFQDRPDIIIGRNSIHFSQASYPVEMHNYNINNLKRLKSGDVMTGDGFQLNFSGESCGGTKEDEVRKLILSARNEDINFLIYRSDMQGIPLCHNGAFLVSAYKRTYKISRKEVLKQLLK